MPSQLNLFPTRIAIGKITGPDGRTQDVLMSPDFARALSDLMIRVGGPTNLSLDDIGNLTATEATSAEVYALRAEVAELQAQVEALGPLIGVLRQIDQLRAEVAMIEDPAAVVRYITARVAKLAPLDSPVFTGIPKAPTPIADTNTDQLATTKYVIGQASAELPQMAANPARVGVSGRYARSDHAHPTDTSKQDKITKATVAGSRGGNAALASLLTGLAGQGLITDSTTA